MQIDLTRAELETTLSALLQLSWAENAHAKSAFEKLWPHMLGGTFKAVAEKATIMRTVKPKLTNAQRQKMGLPRRGRPPSKKKGR